MRKAINAWAFGAAPVERMFALAADAGYEGLELAFAEAGPVSPQATDADIERVHTLAREHGIAVPSIACGLFWQYSLTDPDEGVRRKGLELGRAALRYAAAVGADTLLVIPGAVAVPWQPDRPPVAYDSALERARASIAQLVPVAEETGVRLGLENVWNQFLLSPVEMRDFIDSFQSRFVAAYFDAANVIPFGLPDQWVRILDRRIAKVHAKGFAMPGGMLAASGFVDLLAGQVDWPAVTAALTDVGYDGWLVAEVSPYRHHPAAVLYTTSVALDFILGRRS